ncbi:MAG: S-formylglutathione hydrolase [Micavibrio sp.]|nr:S-formylglutathione hydrolase [Micavibrio sp.]
MKEIENHKCHGGTLAVYEHTSTSLNCDMRFSVFLPPQADNGKVPFLTFLSGLTCTHENFTTKAGAYAYAAEAGLAITAPDTSPRGDNVPDEDDYAFGKGAGFYLDATEEPWDKHFNMESYITTELNKLICNKFPVLADRQGILGHSMGGHGALVLGLKFPKLYQSISAFSPVVAPMQSPWGQNAFSKYLGTDKMSWKNYDATEMMKRTDDRSQYPGILIDQGTDDDFLEEQLKTDMFQEPCAKANQKLIVRMQEGYDHSYYFIQSFIGDHIKHHEKILKAV